MSSSIIDLNEHHKLTERRMAFNLAAFLLSVLAVFTSTWFAIRQANLMRQANRIPAVIELLSTFRSPQFKITSTMYVKNWTRV